MVEWLKIFGLGFFNDKLAAKSENYGFVSVVLAIVLSFLFFMFGFMAADVVPFSTHYDNATQFKEFLHNAVSDDELKIEIKDELAKCEKFVNTYKDEGDREKYARGGYNLIVDTRASDTIIEFTQVAVNGDKEINYEDYLLLSDKDKESYRIENRYTDKQLLLTEERIENYEKYLDGLCVEGTDKYNQAACEEYKKIKDGNLTSDTYGKEIYYLYVRYYYKDIESALMSSKVPVLCDYYFLNYILGDTANYLYIFDDLCVGSFKTDTDIPATVVGYYKGDDGIINSENSDGFIKGVFYSSVGYSMSSYFTGSMQMAPGYILIPILVAAVLFLICKVLKNDFGQKFSGCYKAVNSFVWVSALLTGLLTFILGFFVFARKLYLFMPVIFALILILRTAVFYITRSHKEKKQQEEQIDGDVV